jgi:Rps23 Pro-64 3,4-dihydroxylase Tpa1-like proline 4-hydroxylase
MHDSIKEHNYIYIPNFISPERANELSKNFINFCKKQNLAGDGQAENSHSAYNYIDFLELLCEKTVEVGVFLGETVLPTYSYARVYKEGSTLARHRDREECEISITLHLSGDTGWPIYIQKPDGEEISLDLNTGDAMLYRGDVADHWRDKFEGKEYVQVFLHYVRSRGPNNNSYFDKKRNNMILMDNSAKELSDKIQPKTIPKLTYSKNLDDYIQVFDNIVPIELCESFLNEYANSNEWGATYIGSHNPSIDRSIRNCDTIPTSNFEVIARNQNIRKLLDDQLFKCANDAIKLYNQVFPEAKIEQDSGYELLRYNEGQFYIQHTDSFKGNPRAVSCSFMINDDYEGGEFAFFNREKQYKVKKGSVIMFPSNFMYPHEIMPVTKGVRYSIITWFI